MPISDLNIERVRPDSAAATALMEELDRELTARYPGAPFHGLRPDEVSQSGLWFFLAHLEGVPIGCGALRHLDPRTGELKRMFVRPPFRGQGLGRILLLRIEREARDAGIRVLRLETGVAQPEALALYRRAGYEPIPVYGEYVGDPNSVCFEKRLGPPSAAT
jgi:putative acetyltransferase